MARPLRSFCLDRIRSGGGAASAAAPPPSICGANKEQVDSGGERESPKDEKDKDKKKGGSEATAVVVGRKVIVAADGGGEEARTALQWALSTPSGHATPSSCSTSSGAAAAAATARTVRRDPRGCQHLEAMRSICQAKRPEVRVEVSLAEGKERGPAIVEAARKQGASLLVVGQKKRSVTWRLLSMWMGGAAGGCGGAAADYCVQHAACMALAVRRARGRIPHHHQAAEGFLAPGVRL